MSTPDPIEAYLKELRRRLRWRRGGRRMTEEVEDHLRELAADDEGRGLDPAEARRIAVAQVGPPSALLRRRWYVRPLAAASIGVTAVAVGVALFAHTSAHRAKATGLSPRLEAQEVAAYTKQVPPYLTSRTTLAIALGSGIPVYRPSCGLASDHTIVEIWRAASPGPEFAILYRSALVETIDPARYWGIRSGNAAAVLRRQARSWPNARFLR
ncbi:MAG TPA: permease prefix domain 1-containing protein, partial [Thermoleophilia bacterium]|nr:permease prefix domain 1-containing protein [Thermoleophilia bacterium]